MCEGPRPGTIIMPSIQTNTRRKLTIEVPDTAAMRAALAYLVDDCGNEMEWWQGQNELNSNVSADQMVDAYETLADNLDRAIRKAKI